MTESSTQHGDADMPIYAPMGMCFMGFPAETNLAQSVAEVVVRIRGGIKSTWF